MGSRSKKKRTDDSSSPSSSSSYDDDSDRSSIRSRRHNRKESRSISRNEKDKKRESRIRDKERKKKDRRDRDRDRDRKRKRRKLRREGKRKIGHGSETDDWSRSGNSNDSDSEREKMEPEVVVGGLFKEFPDVGNELKQLLKMIDDGQAVDINGISERSLAKYLNKLFLSLKLKESGERVFLLPSNVRPTLEAIGPLIEAHLEPKGDQALNNKHSSSVNVETRQAGDDNMSEVACPNDEATGPRKRMLGPEMPSAELLAAAAKLTEAQTELREAELEEDNNGLFVGPPPPAMVAEAESANEAERFEEVSRIMEVEGDSPYDILGLNQNISAENIKKRYWKMSLLVHPDKCSHPQANEAFIKLNNAFKELQDPDKRKALDDKIKLKEEQEQFKVELRSMREAAKWRRSQGISMDGDDELLADMDVKVEPKRDEWMTSLPPERKPGVTMQSSKFSKGSKEGRGDTSVWTDTPSDRAQKAKMGYLEAFNEAAALASNEVERKMSSSSDAALVDQYNKEKRNKTLVEKHHEEARNRTKKKSKQQPSEKDNWVGQHPWKPWDREKDLTAGRKTVNFDVENMTQGLGSRFSSGSFQRNFL